MGSTSALKTRAIISNIRRIREGKHYSQEYLAVKLKISQNAYSKIGLGHSNVTLVRLIRIAEVLEIDLVDLVKPGMGETIPQKNIYKQFNTATPAAPAYATLIKVPSLL